MQFNAFLGNNLKKPDNFITRIIQSSIEYMKEKKDVFLLILLR